MASNWLYKDPFPRNYCVVNAWTHATLERPTADDALALAVRAKAVRGPHTRNGHFFLDDCARRWADLCGVSILEQYRAPAALKCTGWFAPSGAPIRRACVAGPTVARFAKDHPVGRWVISVRGHALALALVDGQLCGYWAPRSRMYCAWRVS